MAEFRWLGHNCFRIRAREAMVLTDPVDRSTGYAAAKQSVDVVTLSHEHKGHANLEPQVARRRLTGFLGRRGYGFDVIGPVLRRVFGEDEPDESLPDEGESG